MYLNDAEVTPTVFVKLARAAAEADAHAGRPPQTGIHDPQVKTAYHTAYAMTSFHDAKAKLLANAVVFH